MTLHTLVLIILWSFAIALFIGLMIAVFFIGRKTVKNNPKKALVLVKTGDDIQVYKGKMTDTTVKGYAFTFGDKKIVLVPMSYKQVFVNNKRLLFLDRIGHLITLPFLNDKELGNTEKDDLIYELVSSHIGADGMRALKGKGSSLLMVIIIATIAFIFGAGLMGGYYYYNQKNAQRTQATTSDISSHTIIVPPQEGK